MALTATAPPHMLTNLKQSLSLQKGCKVVAANPNRSNIYYDKKMRMSNHHGFESYDTIVIPIANELAMQREKYPMTIIYLKLKYCGYVYSLFERILQDKQFVGDTKDPAARLFAQFHASQTKRMKKSLIAEVKEENSRVRVLFATSALGMGVDVPHVWNMLYTSHRQATLSLMCRKLDVLEEQGSHLKPPFITITLTLAKTRSMLKIQ